MIAGAVRHLLEAREAAVEAFSVGRATAVATSEAIADATDACVSLVISSAPGSDRGWAVFSVGSLGRREVSIASDVDCALVFRGPEPGPRVLAATDLARALWDAGIRASIAVYNIERAAELSASDDTVFATMLDRRRIAGDPSVDPDPRPSSGVRARVARFAAFLAAQDRARRLEPGLDLFAAEPDLKAGAGGLRDLASIGWLRRVALWPGAVPRSGASRRRLADGLAFLDRRSGARGAARETLLAARHLVCSVQGVRRDRLTREVLARLEEADRASPALPRRLEVSRVEVALERSVILGPLTERPPRPAPFVGPGTTRTGTIAHPPDAAALARAPAELIRFVAACARAGMVPGPEVAAAAREAFAEVRPGRVVSEAFVDLLGGSGVRRAVGWLLEAGLLPYVLPAMRRLVGLVPGDEVHAFTVGRHSAEVASEVADMLDGAADVPAGCAAALASGATMRKGLLLASLLHDLGKSKGPPHEETGAAEAIEAATRAGMSPEEAAEVGGLCRLHMLLPAASVTKDCDDPSVVRALADAIGSVSRADALLLLAVGDQRSLGASASTSFRESLLVRAWRNVRELLEGGADPAAGERELAARREGVVLAAMAAGLAPTAAEVARDLPARYLASFDDSEAVDHLALIEQARVRSPAIQFRPVGATGIYEAAFAGRDELGLLARISGALFLQGLSILEARIFSLPGSAVLDLFRVADPGQRVLGTEEARRRAAERLAADVHDPGIGARVRQRLSAARPLVADVDNTASERFTVVRVGGPDAPGLLWRVADALYRQGLDVGGAIVTTVAGEARDTFFVEWGAGGGKVTDPDAIRRILLAISRV